jgi:hypothetical protein
MISKRFSYAIASVIMAMLGFTLAFRKQPFHLSFYML